MPTVVFKYIASQLQTDGSGILDTIEDELTG